MKIVICTTPIRPEPTSFPPFGSMAVIQSLRLAGHDPYFYDIDGLRPTFEETVEFFANQAPDVVGISAVVSTAYAYTKMLVLAIKDALPKTKVIVGGNLAASAELLLRFCKVDACAIGEGERVVVNLIKYWESHSTTTDYSQLQRIKGISYLDKDNEVTFTGYDAPIPADEFLDPDWTILEKYSRIENYITDPLNRYEFAQDVRSYEPHRRGKKMATVITAKGCVARCTFCHRWDRGYRHWPVDRIIGKMKYLIDRYDVGFFAWGDENFGSDRRKLDDLLGQLQHLDILYNSAGVRVASVDPDLLKRMQASGCTSIYYGMETGSPRILDIMEKNTNLQRNIDATQWTYDAGLYTIYQMVLGMPGENHQTIKETSQFIQRATEFLPEPPHKRLSINFIQALPGTPVYEYARSTGAIGQSLEEEEEYLNKVSDINAADDSKFLNFTQDPYFSVQAWRRKIVFEAEANWYRKHNWKPAPTEPEAARLNGQLPNTESDEDYNRGGYFNLGHSLIRSPLFFRILSLSLCRPLRAMYPTVIVLGKDFVELPKKQFIKYLVEFGLHKLRLQRRTGLKDNKSLRQVMKDRAIVPVTKSTENMQPLRDGR
jgi:anaerobic magnesium-protoporphyrin IX monomethyl ester cyclase